MKYLEGIGYFFSKIMNLLLVLLLVHIDNHSCMQQSVASTSAMYLCRCYQPKVFFNFRFFKTNIFAVVLQYLIQQLISLFAR